MLVANFRALALSDRDIPMFGLPVSILAMIR